jgi:hypothetical protein
MATTTNYGWETPDDTDLVKDGAAAIRTLGSSIDTTTKNLNPETTTGDIAYRSATANTNTRLPIGTTGQVLTVAGGVPSWAAPAGGGKVLQVLQVTTTTATGVSSSTYVDTNLSLAITPSSASSKVLVLMTAPVELDVSGGAGGLRLVRGATTIYDWEGRIQTETGYMSVGVAISYLDSPATTSSTTYKIQVNDIGSGTFEFCKAGKIGSMILMEIGA